MSVKDVRGTSRYIATMQSNKVRIYRRSRGTRTRS
jgi:hypothetical protein